MSIRSRVAHGSHRRLSLVLFFFTSIDGNPPYAFSILLFAGSRSVSMAQTSASKNLHCSFQTQTNQSGTGASWFQHVCQWWFRVYSSGATLPAPPAPSASSVLCSALLGAADPDRRKHVLTTQPGSPPAGCQNTSASTHPGLTWQRTLERCCFTGRVSATQHYHVLLRLSAKSS